MKEAPLQSPCLEQKEKKGLILHKLSFLDKGPYSIDVESGECVGLTGKSGIGKTQLLRAVADVIVHTGDCFLNEYSCQSMEAPEWRKTVALVPAESFWWHDIVGEHFAEIDLHGEFANLLKKLGFSLEVMDWQISRLSTGERQRLSLIRTLITRPAVLLLDEPTSSLDKTMTHVVEEMIVDICSSNKTVCIWVSHDMEQLSRVSSRVFRVTPSGLVMENI